jgi:hypothetical protein
VTGPMRNTIAVDENHPAALAFHSINNAAQIVIAVEARARWSDPPHTKDDLRQICVDTARITELLGDAGKHVGELYVENELLQRAIEEIHGDVKLRDELIAALEDDKRELLEDGMRQAVTIARLEKTDTENKQRLCEAQRKAEDLTRDMAGALAEITELFSRARSIRLYDVDRARPLELTSQEAPRMAAAGGN